jgi:hypothetical protein
MPRGYLSVRIDTQNPRHHLWCNHGSWWVHYTLHFANRKRRIRRSLNTSDARVAIARRDELFARIQRDGEEVAERRPRQNEGEDAMRLAFIASPDHPQHSGASPMSKKRRCALTKQCLVRAHLILEAEVLFSEAKEAHARAEVAERLPQLWLQAGGLFARSAQGYRSSGLGLMARGAYYQARDCYSRAGDDEKAEECEQRAAIIPSYWEEASDE